MESTLNIVLIIIIVFGILQIILFFKLWGMTNDVNAIKSKLEAYHGDEDQLILEAQIKALSGDKTASFELYQKSFYRSLIELFEKTIKEYGDENNSDLQCRDEYYRFEYDKIVKYYSTRVRKLGVDLDTEKFDSYGKVCSIISKA